MKHPAPYFLAISASLLVFKGSLVALERKVFIVAGQSNVLNWHAAASQLASDPRDATIPFFFETGAPPGKGGAIPVNSTSGGKWTVLQVQHQDPFVKYERDFFGPEMSLARALAGSGPLAVIKVGYFGTNLAQDWKPDATSGNQLYSRLRQIIDTAMRGLRANGDQPLIAGFFWMQGETDGANAIDAAAYADNLTKFVLRVRSDIGEPNLPFILGRVGPTPANGYRFQALVRAGQVRVAETGVALAWVDTDDQLRFSDGVHLLAPGVIALGERMAKAWSQLPPHLSHP